MLAEAEGNDYKAKEGGFCFMFYYILDSNSLLVNFINTLPELYLQKPKEAHLFWFPAGQWSKRIELLKQCINETY